MNRSPLRRKTPLARGSVLARKAPPKRSARRLKPRSNRASAKARRAAQEGPQWRLCHTLPCCSCGLKGPGAVHGHHEPPRSRGGLDHDTLPLCYRCHERRHRMGARAFWASCSRDPAAILADLRALVAAGL